MCESNILYILFFIPIIGAIFISFMDSYDESNIKLAAIYTAAFSCIITVCILYFSPIIYDNTILKVCNFTFSINAINKHMIAVSAFLIFLSALIARIEITIFSKEFSLIMLLIHFFTIVLYTSDNLSTFYAASECISILILVLFNKYTQSLRKIIIFCAIFFVKSLCMLFCILYIKDIVGSTEINIYKIVHFSINQEKIIFISMFIWLFLHIIFFPLHNWILEFYKKAPASLSILFVGTLLTICNFGFFYILCPVISLQTKDIFMPFICILSCFNIVYVCTKSIDKKNYYNDKYIFMVLSFLYMNYSIIGFLSEESVAINGAYANMMVHPILISGLLIFSFMLRKYSYKYLQDIKGLYNVCPYLCIILWIMLAVAINIPIFICACGKISVIISVFSKNYLYAIILCGSLISTSYIIMQFYSNMFINSSNSQTSIGDNFRVSVYDYTCLLLPIVCILFFNFFQEYFYISDSILNVKVS